jgi:hypothetical protein
MQARNGRVEFRFPGRQRDISLIFRHPYIFGRAFEALKESTRRSQTDPERAAALIEEATERLRDKLEEL